MLAETAHARNEELLPSIQTTILSDSRLSRNAKLVGMIMITVGDGRPFHRPMDDLLRLAGMKRPTFIHARRDLERLGYLRLERDGRFIRRYVPTLPSREGRS